MFDVFSKNIKLLSLILILYSCSYASVDEVDVNQNDIQSNEKELKFNLNNTLFQVGEEISFSLFYSNEYFKDINVSENVLLEAIPADMVQITQTKQDVKLKGLKPGKFAITASYQRIDVTKILEIFSSASLVVSSNPMNLENVSQFTLQVTYQNGIGETQAISGPIEWTSLTPNTASVDQNGLVNVLSQGLIQIQIKAMALTTVFETNPSSSVSPLNPFACQYPEPTTGAWNQLLEVGTVIPPIYWENAYAAQGTHLSKPLDLVEIFCGGEQGEFNNITTINFILTTGWCPACPDYIREVAALNPTLENQGGLVIYVEIQDDGYQTASSDYASSFLNRLVGNTNGYVVGDFDTMPSTPFFDGSPAIDAFPTALVVRRSDMKIISSQGENRDIGTLPFVEMAQNPNQDWKKIQAPSLEEECGSISNGNNNVTARTVNQNGDYMGSLCNGEYDFFYIQKQGNWRATLSFDTNTSDLNLLLLDPYQPNPSAPIASSIHNNMIESLQGSDMGLLMIMSPRVSSVPYVLRIE